jgi:cytochrome d ubiquinol oxidase subunit II
LAFGYSVLGAGWLYLKANRVIERFAIASLRMLTPTFLILSGIGCLYAARVQPEIHVAWVMHSAVLSIVTVLIVLVGATLTFIPLRGRTAVPFTLGIVLFLLGMAGFAVTVFPNIIPFKLSLWEAASSSSSQIFLLAGAALVTPVILAYTAFAYWVFRGRTPERGWGE